MTALLINIGTPGGSGAPRTAGPAPAILDTEGSGSLLRFGETLSAHASDGPGQPGDKRAAGGGLLATRTADADLQIDDADILRQLTNANGAAIARARVTVGARDASSDDSDVASEEGEQQVSPVPLTTAAVELPSVPANPVPADAALAAAEVAKGVGQIRDVAGTGARVAAAAARGADDAQSPTTPRAAIGTVAATFAIEGSSALAKSSLPPSVSVPRAAEAAALLAMNATSGADQQSSNLLPSQSQPLLMALASNAPDASGQSTAGADKVVDAQPSTANRQALVDALGERLSVQLSRGSSQATIRLDPPMMGTIEIVIRHDAAGVQVHLSASHGDVLRQLHNIGNALSQDLVQRNHGEVTVHISESSRDGEGRQRHREDGAADGDSTPGHALRLADEAERAPAFTLA